MRSTSPRHLSTRRTRPRYGFTLVELLVVIAIIGMLVALLIPAVGAARARMRKAACLNNMRQIGTALIAYDSNKQRLPGYIEPVKARSRNNNNKTNGYVIWNPGGVANAPSYVQSSYYNGGPNSTPAQSRIAWSAHILPQIDRQDLWELVQGAETQGGDTALLNQQTVPKIELYVCADDTDLTSEEGAAGISYSVNTGSWDADGSNFVGNIKENGLFNNLVAGNTKSQIANVKDGTSTTLMVTENISKNWGYSWMGVPDGNTSGEQQFGIVWVVNTQPSLPCGGLNDQAPFDSDGELQVGTWPADAPCYARPFANHADGSFNAIYADGHGGSLNPTLDYVVYQQILTTHGAKCVDPTDPNSDTGAIRTFRTAPPLSEEALK